MSKQAAGKPISIRELIITGREWMSYLFSKWLIIVVVGLLGGVAGFTYAYLQKPVYTAALSFALDDDSQGGGGGGAFSLASQFGFDLGVSGGGIFSGANLVELFRSRTIVEQTLLTPVNWNGKTVSHAEMYIQVRKWRDQWTKNDALKNIQYLPNANRQQFTRLQDSILGVMYQELSSGSLNILQKDKKTDIITIELQSGNEYFAKYFTEALAKEVSDFYIATKSKKSRLNMAILEKQTDSIRAELNAAITGVAVANDNTFALNPALNVRRAPSSRRQVDVQANSAILTELVKQTELAKVTLRKETPLIQVIDRPILPLKKTKPGKLKSLVLGGIIFGFLAVLILVLRRAIKKIMEPEAVVQ